MTSPVAASVAGVVARFGSDRTRLMDIVLEVQARFGQVSDEAVRAISTGLDVHAVEVEDMVSFYAFFDRGPRGRNRIRLSKTPVSFLKGAKDLARAFEEALGVPIGQTTSDGAFTVEWTSDIGLADQEPSALVNGTPLSGLTPEDVPMILMALGGSGSARPGEAQGLPKAVTPSRLVKAGPLLTGPLSASGGLKAALALTPEAVIAVIAASNLRGRGGAGFPTGMKWRLTRKASGEQHYLACNADEGETGTFKDRLLLLDYPDLVFDGMTVAGYALGARTGLLYLRGEYAAMRADLERVLQDRRSRGLLGAGVCGKADFDFDIRIQLGAGAYICGEESSLLESLEGKRGSPRDRPPFPTERDRQRRDARLRRPHHGGGRSLVHGPWDEGVRRHEADVRLRRLRAARRLRNPFRHHRERAPRSRRRA
jgi:[NiFe] hydrogenase diaphorase moiety large subunit